MFSQACKYGIRATLYLSIHTNEEKKAGVTEIADALSAPQPFLAKILQLLSKNNIISSVKGPNGGFYLNVANNDLPIISIINCIDGKDVFNSCVMGLAVCSSENPCPLHIQAFAYRSGLLYQLKYQSFRVMAQRVQKENLKI